MLKRKRKKPTIFVPGAKSRPRADRRPRRVLQDGGDATFNDRFGKWERDTSADEFQLCDA